MRAKRNWLILKVYINLYLICRVFIYDHAEHIFFGHTKSRKKQLSVDKVLPKGFFNPEWKIIIFKDWLVSLVSIYYIFTIPLKWATDSKSHSQMYTDLVIDTFMMVDIWVRMYTAVRNKYTGGFICDFKIIAEKRFSGYKSLKFFVIIIRVLPLYLIKHRFLYFKILWIFKIFDAIRCIKMLFFVILKLFLPPTLNFYLIQGFIVKLVEVISIFSLCLHCMTCMWVVAQRISMEDEIIKLKF